MKALSEKNIVMGILAHVDAGKTTLSEALLYHGGVVSSPGRVDHKDAFFDTARMERKRGITIYFKQAAFDLNDLHVTLLDTPGHSDLSAEAERVISILDCAILVISGTEGVQSHTLTLWKLFKEYNIPVFMFVNKMDRSGTDKESAIKEIRHRLSPYAVDFTERNNSDFYESIALCSEKLMESYINTDKIGTAEIAAEIRNRAIFPVCFGSALKLTGTAEFAEVLSEFAIPPENGTEFGARVFKISRDERGSRLTHMKVTGGSLKVRDTVNGEKISRIRIYSGESFREVQEAPAGTVCAVPGLTNTHRGDGLGNEAPLKAPLLKPLLSYKVSYKTDTDPLVLYEHLKELEEEEPELHVTRTDTSDALQPEIMAEIMGDVQTEVLIEEVKTRYNTDIEFTEGSVNYTESEDGTLLEPYCEYDIKIPTEFAGRVMTDLDAMCAKQGEIYHHETETVLTGRAPYSTIRNYQRELNSRTKGLGRITLTMCGYDTCHNPDEVPWFPISETEEDEQDEQYSEAGDYAADDERTEAADSGELWISPDEVERILNRTYRANSVQGGRSNRYAKKIAVRDDLPDVVTSNSTRKPADKSGLQKYLLVDGYNVIFAWQELAELVKVNIDSARDKLLDILENYSGMSDTSVIAVFDAYRLEDHPEEISRHGNISVVFTKTAQTADAYIEKFVHDNRGKYDISVVTSDRLEQIIIMGNDASLISSREFESRVREVNERIRSMLGTQPAIRVGDVVRFKDRRTDYE